jgi:hypothetical protein
MGLHFQGISLDNPQNKNHWAGDPNSALDIMGRFIYNDT